MSPSTTVQALIQQLNLQPHPEGGYFAETYRAAEAIPHGALPKRFTGDRSFSTAIYFLIPAGSRSSLHRIQSDETWHFYLGGPITLVQLSEDGVCQTITMGSDFLNGQYLQYTVPAGCWFGAIPMPETEFALLGCTVAPGFDFEDFELATQRELLATYPGARSWIEQLTPSEPE
jgi:predicted cupin superfamily sugar epimerase